MNLLGQKVDSVKAVFNKLDEEIAKLQNWSSLHCEYGCGKCCFKPDIEATVLEFLPFALSVFNAQKAEEWLDKLSKEDSTICMILHPSQTGAGLCSDYTHRGLICRLFGFSARTNKYGKKELITCPIIKSNQAEKFLEAENKINAGSDVPVMNEFYMQLASIDFELAREFYPINVALRKAIETVLHYYAYR
ncbi:MAG: YkgJ family cysteine cluster protein [Bacteroidetes bacterium]|nr:YkgJ family cysteine cluster protein [Bacteroidota bacterium]